MLHVRLLVWDVFTGRSEELLEQREKILALQEAMLSCRVAFSGAQGQADAHRVLEAELQVPFGPV